MDWKVTYCDYNGGDSKEILVQADSKTDAYINVLVKLGPNYYPKSGKGDIIDIKLVNLP